MSWGDGEKLEADQGLDCQVIAARSRNQDALFDFFCLAPDAQRALSTVERG